MLSGPFRFAHRIVPKGRTTSSAAWLAARTLAVDAAVAAAFDAGIEQLVILGAGYDSRAWRLAPAGVAVFEIDHPATQLVKQARAPAGPGPTYVSFDLSAAGLHGALLAAGVDPERALVATVDGLTMYLSEPQVAVLLADLARVAAPSSTLVAGPA